MSVRLAAALLLGLALPAAAQDWNAMNQAFNDQLNAQMQAGLDAIIRQNMADRRIQAMYQQAVASGQFQGTLADYAYAYAATGGFTPQGYGNLMASNAQIAGQHDRMMADYWASQQGIRDAFAGWTGGFAANQQEAGLGLMGQSTWQGGYGPQQAPHTWAPGSTHQFNGQTWHVDQTGQYWMADPNGSGWWMPYQR